MMDMQLKTNLTSGRSKSLVSTSKNQKRDNLLRIHTIGDKNAVYNRLSPNTAGMNSNLGISEENNEDEMILQSVNNEEGLDAGFEDDLPRINSSMLKPDLCEISEEDTKRLRIYEDSPIIRKAPLEEQKRLSEVDSSKKCESRNRGSMNVLLQGKRASGLNRDIRTYSSLNSAPHNSEMKTMGTKPKAEGSQDERAGYHSYKSSYGGNEEDPLFSGGEESEEEQKEKPRIKLRKCNS